MNRKPSLLVVFLTVFIDLIGFGIVVPLVPIFSRHYGASGWVIGAALRPSRPPAHITYQHRRRGVVVCPVRRRVGI